jgi:CubicO group peptidase (beta-lactamase class C family)
MRDSLLYISCGVLLAFRALIGVKFWSMPNTMVPGRFFGLPVDATAAKSLLRRYHRLIVWAYALELLVAVGFYLWFGIYGLTMEQVVAACGMRIYHSLVGIHVIRLAKHVADKGSWRPQRSMAVMLSTRRLRDFVNMKFEVLLPLLTLASFLVLAFQLSRTSEEAAPSLLLRCALFGVLAIYLQLGGLLIKHSLVKWRWRMPAERVEEYRRWRESVLLYWLWSCDYLRLAFTIGLVSFVGIDLLYATGAEDRTVLFCRVILAGIIVVPGILSFERQKKRMKLHWKALQPLDAFSFGPDVIDKNEFYFGGIVYWNPENPALFVPGPLVYAINLANRRSYLYAAYLAILVPLIIWCGFVPQRAQGADFVPVATSQEQTKPKDMKAAITPERLKRIAAGVKQLIEDDEAVGAEVLILHHNKPVLNEAFGLADLDRKTPLAVNTIVCIRSMTKPLVGTAVQMLVDEGKLALTDKASKFLPAFDNDKSRAITVEQLLTHSAGFPLTHIDKGLPTYSGQRAVADQAGQKGPTTPAGKFSYSDCDTETLAAVVSVVSGEPVDAFIRKRILEPLGMHDTFLVLGENAPRARISSNHAGSPGMWHKYWDHEEKPFFPFFLGAAAAYSTAGDYAKFLSLWLNHGKVGDRRLLSEAAIQRALHPAFAMLSPGSNAPYPTALKPLKPFYGQHWMIYQESMSEQHKETLPIFGHGGSDGTLALVFPEQDLMVFYYTQSRGGMSTFRFEELVAPLLGLEEPPTRTRLTLDQLKPYVGDYVVDSGKGHAWITICKNRLRLELPGGAGSLLPLWPDVSGQWKFGEAAPGIAVSFEKDQSQAVTGMRLLQNKTQLVHYKRFRPPASLPSVDRVMSFLREKQGGERIDAIKTLEMKGKLRAGATEFETVAEASGPKRVIRRLSSPAGTTEIVVDDGVVTKKSPGQPNEEQHRLFAEESQRYNPLTRLHDWRETHPQVQVLGIDQFGDEEVWVLRVECQFTPPLTRFVSTKRGLLLREEAWLTAKGVGTVPLSLEYEDYRNVSGVMLPFRLKTESRLTGKQVTEFTEMKANGGK